MNLPSSESAAPFEAFDLRGKNAVVTGGATGLGYHMTRALARAGAKVMIGARREGLLREATDRLMSEPHITDVRWRKLDLEDQSSIASFAEHAIASMGGVDIFVGNAGIVQAELIDDIKLASMASLIQIHYASNISLVQAFIPAMRERKWGRILFSSSIASLLGTPQTGNIIYASAKAGLNALARTLAADLGRSGITANALVLGLYGTELLLGAERHIRQEHGEAAAKKFMATYKDITALGRLGDPADVEGIVQLLASNAGSYITGQAIAIDGGTSIMLKPYQTE